MTDKEFWKHWCETVESAIPIEFWKQHAKLIEQTKGQQNMNEDEFVVKDSGNREHFTSGAVRDTADDKPRPDLISPFFIVRLGEHLRKGAVKYSEWNWAKGIPQSRCFASCMRHLMAYAMGKRDEDHLAAAAFNIMAIIHTEETAGKYFMVDEPGTPAPINDMPRFREIEEFDV